MTTALPFQTTSGLTTAVPPMAGPPQTLLPGWGLTSGTTGHGTRAAARALSNATVISVVTQIHGGNNETAGPDPAPGAGPPNISGASDPGARGTVDRAIGLTPMSIPTNQVAASSSDIPWNHTREPGYAQNLESDDWNTQGEPIIQENTPQAPEPPLPPRPSRRPTGKTKGPKKKSNKRSR